MPAPEGLDHVLVAALIAVLPFYGARVYRRLVRRVRAGDPHARVREYRTTIITQWSIAALVLALWWGMARPADSLGLALPGGTRLLVGATLTALGLALLYGQWRGVAALDEKGVERLRRQMESVADLLPRTDREAALFRRLSVTAGVSEELVYRGYLIWYLAGFVGAWPAALLAGVVFGILHVYQGPTGVLKTGVTGVAMGALYVGTGSLLWPMVLHAAVDVHGGAIARRVLEPDSSAVGAS